MSENRKSPPAGSSEEVVSLLRTRAEHAEALADRLLEERRKREEVETRFRIAFHTSPDAVNINRVDDGMYIDINEGFTRATGYEREEVIGRTSADISIWHNPDDRAYLVEELRRTGECLNLRTQFVMKDGSIIIGLMSAKLIMLDDVPHILSITRDVSDMARAEELLAISERQLRESETKYRRMIEDAPILVVQADEHLRIRFFNTALADLFDLALDAAVGDHMARHLKHDEFALLKDMLGRLSVDSPSNTVTSRMETVKGVRWIHWTNQAFFEPDGGIREYQGIGIDITERKRMEDQLLRQKEELARLNRNLEEEVARETERRRRQERVLFEQNKFAAMGQMISAIAHQWRQPLTALGLELQDMEDAWHHDELNQEYIDRFTSITMRLVLHMSETIDDFRNFFKTDEMNRIFSVVDAVHEVMELVRAQLKSEQVTFNVAFPGRKGDDPNETYSPVKLPGFDVYGSPGEFKQVLLNIVQNARAAIADRRRNAGIEEGRIDIRLARDGEEVVISVSDNGCGIDKTARDRLFEPYFTTREEGQGTGIGLYMSRLIVEDHMGGTIRTGDCDSGALFVITLPGVVTGNGLTE